MNRRRVAAAAALAAAAGLGTAAAAQADEGIRTGSESNNCRKDSPCGPWAHDHCQRWGMITRGVTGCTDMDFVGNPICFPGNAVTGATCLWTDYNAGTWVRAADGRWLWTADRGHWQEQEEPRPSWAGIYGGEPTISYSSYYRWAAA